MHLDVHLLYTQVLRCICNMLIRKARHEVIAVIVVWLEAEVDALVVASFLCRCYQVLGEKLFLFVKVVASTLPP